MGPAAPAVVRLVRTLHRSRSLRRMLWSRRTFLAADRTPNGTQMAGILSIIRGVLGQVSYGARRVAMVDSWVFLTRPRLSLSGPHIGFVPKVFHTCGKNCGKPGCCHETERREGRATAYFGMAKEVTARQDRHSGRRTGKDPVKTSRFWGAKVPLNPAGGR
jgi:hypothetical protein